MNHQPWIAAINRLLMAELRPNPRPKPGAPATPKYWNKEDLAAAADIRANTLSDVMRGKREPSVSTLIAIAKALNVTAAALLMDADEAAAYASFRQARATTTQSAAIEETVQRILDQRGEEMKAQWIALQTRSVLADLTGQKAETEEHPIAVPSKRRKVGR